MHTPNTTVTLKRLAIISSYYLITNLQFLLIVSENWNYLYGSFAPFIAFNRYVS